MYLVKVALIVMFIRLSGLCIYGLFSSEKTGTNIKIAVTSERGSYCRLLR